MDRLFLLVGLCAMLLLSPVFARQDAQPAFFSMLFPQLMPDGASMDGLSEATPGEAVLL